MSLDERSWETIASESVLLNAVSNWRHDSDKWLSHSIERLSETVRVNPLRDDKEWVENWLEENDAKKIKWFTGVGSAWVLPFERGKAEGDVKVILSALHETGRLTRQEAVSMIPAIALDAQPGDLVLDMCASPGSKTTQIAEHLNEKGIVMANEVVNSRINTLVANTKRHGSITPIIVHHDGRFIPKVPQTGFDKVLVDAPCTGSATTRKNPDVWNKWLPSGGRTLHKLQLELLTRAISLTKPGGRIVYSTCSLDPIENEAVVAEILRKFDYLSLIPTSKLIGKVPGRKGITEWPNLNDEGSISDWKQVESSMHPPSENEIKKQLPKCLRIWNDDVDAGGFFVAVFSKSSDYEEKKINIDRVLNDNQIKPDEIGFPQPVDSAISGMIEESLEWKQENLWKRGKNILWSTREAKEIWRSDRSKRSGRTFIPGNRWRPLRVIHLGLLTLKLQENRVERIVGRAVTKIVQEIGLGKSEVSSQVIDELLMGKEPPAYEISLELNKIRGGHILIEKNQDTCLPVWIGGRVSLMISEQERRVSRAKRKLPIILDEEE
ncbi:MAG: RsmB/NOP family class I SAM-dependent RNA methyltransferase [Candidatus Thalassarchaeaceae archaeon]|nr:RsmB/NOP family class I SAM-dependent RNA methyltransferase [Candidatus Thalassarchaeaceae archaeon]